MIFMTRDWRGREKLDSAHHIGVLDPIDEMDSYVVYVEEE